MLDDEEPDDRHRVDAEALDALALPRPPVAFARHDGSAPERLRLLHRRPACAASDLLVSSAMRSWTRAYISTNPWSTRLRFISGGMSMISLIPAFGPAVITPIRVPRSSAFSMSWVMKSTVTLCSCQMRRSSSWSTRRFWASRAAKGSSITSIRGWFASTRASCTRWRIPPESSCGYLCPWSARPTSSRNSPVARARSAARAPLIRNPNSTFCAAVSHS